MHDKHLAVIEPGEQVFGAPLKRLHCPAREPARERVRKRKAQIGAPLLDARKRLADEERLEPLAHGFDLGEFRHDDQL
jgi:hypothetical protein